MFKNYSSSQNNAAQHFLFQGYKVYYTTKPHLPVQAWQSQTVDNNQLTTISDLQTHSIYTIRVQAYTSRGPGPLSAPIQMKTQQGGKFFALWLLCTSNTLLPETVVGVPINIRVYHCCNNSSHLKRKMTTHAPYREYWDIVRSRQIRV